MNRIVSQRKAEVSLPLNPEPLQVELEFTGTCNARCSACPRDDMPKSGLMSEQTLDRILTAYLEARESYAINGLLQRTDYPKITVAGGGDPFIHPDALSLLNHAVERGFQTHLITNASKLTPSSTEALARLGLSSICVSFWGIKRTEYERAMNLPYEQTLEKVERLAQTLRRANVPMCILWVRSPEISSTSEEIAAFWSERSIMVDLTDNHMWNRGGLTTMPKDWVAPECNSLPDLNRRIWCADLFFSDTYRWNGDCVLCCCNYFTSRPYILGNIHANSVAEFSQLKAELLTAKPIPSMCQVCQLPRQLRARWLAEPWLERVTQDEHNMVTYV